MNRRRIAIVLGVVVLLSVATYYWRHRGEQDPLAAFTIPGNVDVHQVELAFRVSGRITQLGANEGDRIRQGDVLAKLDDVPFQNDVAAATAKVAEVEAQLRKATRGFRPEEVAQARAAVQQREADVANAQVTARRLRELHEKQLVTRQQLDDAEARLRSSEAQLASAEEQLKLVMSGSRIEDIDAQKAVLAGAQAQLAKARTALADTTLHAPSNGVVAVRTREVGAIVQAGQTVYTLALVDPVWVRAYVPEPRLGRIKPGMQVGITTDSMPGKQYPGTVGFISPEAEFTPKNVQTEQVRDDLVYRIRVIAADPDQVFRQGMPVTVHIPEAAEESN